MMSNASADWLAVAEGVAREEARRAVAAQIRHDHPVAGRRQQRCDVDEAVDVVGPAVQEDDRRAVGRTGFGVADVQERRRRSASAKRTTSSRRAGKAPGFAQIAGYINTPSSAPLTLASLKGKVVLVDFWTYQFH